MNELRNYINVVGRELRSMVRDEGVMLIMLGAIFIYTSFYAMIYGPQTLESMSIAVIDESNTPSSREFVQKLNATPNVQIGYEPSDMEEAKKLLFDRKVNGIMLIPSDYEKNIEAARQTTISIYSDASYFLKYKQFFIAFTSVLIDQNIEITTERLLQKGQSSYAAKSLSQPISTGTTILFNPEEGYATFVMPAIMILILQQTMLLGIGIIGGTQREFGLYRTFKDQTSNKPYSVMSILLGKITAYFLFAIALCFCVFGAYYKILGYPIRNSDIETLIFFIPYILSCAVLGVAISCSFKYRESAILVLVAWSLPFLLISGVSFPRQGIPEFLDKIALAIPSTSGIRGFNRLHVMGAPLESISTEINTLWILSGVYFVAAWFALRARLRIERKTNNDDNNASIKSSK